LERRLTYRRCAAPQRTVLAGRREHGKAEFDNCEIAAQVPEVLSGLQGVLGAAAAGAMPISYCHQETGFIPQYKALASYTLPWYGIRVSRHAAEPARSGAAGAEHLQQHQPHDVDDARPAVHAAQANANLLAPGERLRRSAESRSTCGLTKIVNVGKGRRRLSVDFYNAFNSDAVILENATFGPAWRRPLTVIQPRFVKFQARWDF
jgi:hypothetical protein